MSVKRWKDVADVQEELDAVRSKLSRLLIALEQQTLTMDEFLERAWPLVDPSSEES